LVQCSQKVWFKLRSTKALKNSALSKHRTGLVVWFGAFTEPWTEPQSSSEKFRFELWFRTELRHPYWKKWVLSAEQKALETVEEEFKGMEAERGDHQTANCYLDSGLTFHEDPR
jgi:hypothetical protein